MVEKYHFFHRLKVRWSEIDGQNIVFNAHYLTYLDVAASEYFYEGLKLNLRELAGNEEFDYVVVKSTLEYKSSAHLSDWLTIWVRTKSIGRSSFTISYKITREADEDLILLGETVCVCYNARTKSSAPIPVFIRERIEEYENQNQKC